MQSSNQTQNIDISTSDLSQLTSMPSRTVENIQVYLRIRPRNACELETNDESVFSISDNDTVNTNVTEYNSPLTQRKNNFPLGSAKSFTYNRCYKEDSNTSNVYNESIQNIVLSSLEGINGTVFMYGQTGSGKTHTMLGDFSKEIAEMSSKKRTYSKNRCSSAMLTGTPAKVKRMKSMNYSAKKNPTLNSRMSMELNGMHTYRSVSPLDKCMTSSMTNNDIFGTEIKISPTRGGGLDRASSETPLSSALITDGGILIMALKDIFSKVSEQKVKTFIIKCCYFEIYNDLVYDMLVDKSQLDEPLAIAEDNKKDFYIRNITEVVVNSIEDCLDKLSYGEINRHYAVTTMNHQSSRSHTIFRLSMQSVTTENAENAGPESTITESVLNFIDLAGSEKVSNHQAIGDISPITKGSVMEYATSSPSSVNKVKDRVKEGQYINKSLFFLTQVISLKADGNGGGHIPYRNSPLTKILRSSLGGNSRTAIILCITPTYSQYEQTLSTLRFGQSAKKIENKIRANVTHHKDEEALKLLISQYEKRLAEFERNKSDNSENLMKIIKDLQDQKKFLSERLVKEAAAYGTNGVPFFGEEIENEPLNKTIYLENIGILKTHKQVKALLKKKNTKNFASEYQVNKEKMLITALKKSQTRLRKNMFVTEKLKQYVEKSQVFTSSLVENINKIKNRNDSMHQSLQQHKDKTKRDHDTIRKLCDYILLIEKSNDIKEMPVEDLKKLEDLHLINISKIKNEYSRRESENKINILQHYIQILVENNKKLQSEVNAEIDGSIDIINNDALAFLSKQETENVKINSNGDLFSRDIEDIIANIDKNNDTIILQDEAFGDMNDSVHLHTKLDEINQLVSECDYKDSPGQDKEIVKKLTFKQSMCEEVLYDEYLDMDLLGQNETSVHKKESKIEEAIKDVFIPKTSKANVYVEIEFNDEEEQHIPEIKLHEVKQDAKMEVEEETRLGFLGQKETDMFKLYSNNNEMSKIEYDSSMNNEKLSSSSCKNNEILSSFDISFSENQNFQSYHASSHNEISFSESLDYAGSVALPSLSFPKNNKKRVSKTPTVYTERLHKMNESSNKSNKDYLEKRMQELENAYNVKPSSKKFHTNVAKSIKPTTSRVSSNNTSTDFSNKKSIYHQLLDKKMGGRFNKIEFSSLKNTDISHSKEDSSTKVLKSSGLMNSKTIDNSNSSTIKSRKSDALIDKIHSKSPDVTRRKLYQ